MSMRKMKKSGSVGRLEPIQGYTQESSTVALPAEALIASLRPLVRMIGEEAVSKDVDKLASEIDDWLDTDAGNQIANLAKLALTDKFAHTKLCEVVYGANKCAEGVHPQRICTALCCNVLEAVVDKLSHLKHVRTLFVELMRSIYKDYDEETVTGLGGFLHATPYFEEARCLHTQVKRLVKERRALEEAEATAEQRREMRKKVLLRTSARWQMMLLSGTFRQWRETCHVIKRQRATLAQYLGRLKAVSMKDVFRAWRGWHVESKLNGAMWAKKKHESEVEVLETQLAEALETEEQITTEMKSMEEEVEALKAKLVATLAAIEAQKVKETMAVINAVGEALVKMGDLALSNVRPLLHEVRDSPCIDKIVWMWYAQAEEDANREAATKKIQQEAVNRDAWKLKLEKAEKKKAKRRKRETARMESEQDARAEEAREEADAIFRQEIEDQGEDADTSTLTADLEKRCAAAEKVARKAVAEKWKAKWAAEEKAEAEKEAIRIAKLDAEIVIQDREFHAKMNKRDCTVPSQGQLDKTIEGLKTLPCDRLLVRWIKYHLRRVTRSGFPYRRKVINFANDLRDGVSYVMLAKRIMVDLDREAEEEYEPKSLLWSDESKNLDTEIDPQIRIDAVMDAGARLDPPATAFVTRGHILGQDTFLNAAYGTRLMSTYPHMPWPPAAPIWPKYEEYKVLKERWEAAKVNIEALRKWDSWVQMREDKTDKELDTMLNEMKVITTDLAALVTSLDPLREKALQGRTLWCNVYDRMQGFMWQLFSVKVLQEDQAPLGTDPDPDQGHAPFQLVDIRFEKKFLVYTKLRRSMKIRPMLDFIRTRDLKDITRHEREQELIAELKAGEELVWPQEDLDMLEALEAPPLTDEEAEGIMDDIEKMLRGHYDDLQRIFKHYAAGGEGGAATDLSVAELWSFCNDCKYMNGKQFNKIGKDEVQVVFDNTEDTTPTEEEEEEMLPDFEDSAGDDDDDEDDEGDDDEGDDDGENKEGEEEEEEEYSWDLDDDEREIEAQEWIECIIDLSLRKYTKVESLSKRFELLMTEYVLPNACKSNTDTFRGELSMDEVQAVYKKFRGQLQKIFFFYAKVHPRIPGQPPQEPSLDGPRYLKCFKESKVVTRKGDLRHDFPELAARKVFQDVQMEEEEAGSIDAGGGDDEMIYMEYLEALGAITCYKFVNPYIPLHTKMEEFFSNMLFPAQKKYALKRPKKKSKKLKKVKAAAKLAGKLAVNNK